MCCPPFCILHEGTGVLALRGKLYATNICVARIVRKWGNLLETVRSQGELGETCASQNIHGGGGLDSPPVCLFVCIAFVFFINICGLLPEIIPPPPPVSPFSYFPMISIQTAILL